MREGWGMKLLALFMSSFLFMLIVGVKVFMAGGSSFPDLLYHLFGVFLIFFSGFFLFYFSFRILNGYFEIDEESDVNEAMEVKKE